MPDHDPATIDRVAAAIADADGRAGEWDRGTPGARRTYRTRARAALDAMPQPIGYATMRPGRESVDNECDYIEDLHNFPADAEDSALTCRAIFGAGAVVALVPIGAAMTSHDDDWETSEQTEHRAHAEGYAEGLAAGRAELEEIRAKVYKTSRALTEALARITTLLGPLPEPELIDKDDFIRAHVANPSELDRRIALRAAINEKP